MDYLGDVSLNCMHIPHVGLAVQKGGGSIGEVAFDAQARRDFPRVNRVSHDAPR